jgi:hypothetical protein
VRQELNNEREEWHAVNKVERQRETETERERERERERQ